MKLPNAELARVDRSKIVDYLLCVSHPDGATKAEFFGRFRFDLEHWQDFARALKRHGQAHPVSKIVESDFGTRYSVEGELETPDGRKPRIRTVWIMDKGNRAPRLITAHPLEEQQ